ncbi:MAG: ferredoxin:thioredoxin reductase [Methanoregulaceae archaeon]|nr:ferredoxin:thioredoxin reductase [Methanoregulaceae archaeon]
MEEDQMEKDILEWAAKYAKEHDLSLNPDDKRLRAVVKGLARNMKKFGEKYCPCRIRSGDVEADKKIVCPCVYHKDEIEAEGSCHCALYFGKDQEKSPESIK